MAQSKKPTEETVGKNVKKKEVNLDGKVNVVNIAAWNVTFARIDGLGSFDIAPRGVMRMTRAEIISQVQNGNKLFTGKMGDGNHPTLFIDDSATRQEVGYEDADGTIKQIVFSYDSVKDIYEINRLSEFERAVKDKIQTRAEKYAVIEAIKDLNLNDFSKNRFIEKYTGFTIA